MFVYLPLLKTLSLQSLAKKESELLFLLVFVFFVFWGRRCVFLLLLFCLGGGILGGGIFFGYGVRFGVHLCSFFSRKQSRGCVFLSFYFCCLFVCLLLLLFLGGICSVMVDGFGCICAVSFLGSSLVAMLWTLGCLGYAEVYVPRARITKGKGSGVEVTSCTRDNLAAQVVVREMMFRVSSACHAGFKEVTGRRGRGEGLRRAHINLDTGARDCNRHAPIEMPLQLSTNAG